MRAMVAIVATWLALGCDDPAVSSAISLILDHGVARAQATCVFIDAATVDTSNPGNIGELHDVKFDVVLMADGSASVTTISGDNPRDVGSHRFIPRSHANADDLRTVFDNGPCDSQIDMRVDSGDLILSLHDTVTGCPSIPDPQDFASADIETECTGFNLEAFD